MKHVRKIFAFAVALFMAFAVALPAFAAELTETTPGTTKSITITTPASAQSTDSFNYTVYKVFDATSDGESANISYKATAGTEIEATDQLSKFKADAQGNVRYYTRENTESAYTENNQGGNLSDGMIAAIASYSGKTEVGTVTITGANESKTVNVKSYGYFYITTTSGTVVTVDSTNPSATVNDKNTLPTMDKDIASVTSANGGNHATGTDNEDENPTTATANVGDTINYTVTINAKEGADSYVYHDVLSAGLTLVTTTEPVVTAGNQTLVKGTDYTLTKFANNTTNGTDDNITITFAKTYLDSITADTNITITYSASLNERAVIGNEGNTNSGTLDYGHNANGQPNTTPADEPKIYSYKFQLVKDNAEKKVLTGAEFKLYQDEQCTNEIALVKVSDAEYRVATAAEKAAQGFTAATIEAGTPKINGLGNGVYYLKETKAPAGYNMLAAAAEVTINGANNEAAISGDTYTNGGVEVVNQAGTEMPSTGGIGTTIFYVVGGVMVAGAVVFLLTKRRVNAE